MKFFIQVYSHFLNPLYDTIFHFTGQNTYYKFLLTHLINIPNISKSLTRRNHELNLCDYFTNWPYQQGCAVCRPETSSHIAIRKNGKNVIIKKRMVFYFDFCFILNLLRKKKYKKATHRATGLAIALRPFKEGRWAVKPRRPTNEQGFVFILVVEFFIWQGDIPSHPTKK